jgi:hypothetical protein
LRRINKEQTLSDSRPVNKGLDGTGRVRLFANETQLFRHFLASESFLSPFLSEKKGQNEVLNGAASFPLRRGERMKTS